MIIPQERTLLKNKLFGGLLVVGIAISLAGVAIRAVENEKVANDTCASGTCYGARLCYQYGYVYCCGSQGSDCFGCSLMGEDCNGYVIAEWVLFGVSIAVLIGLIVVAKRHKLNASKMVVGNMEGQNIVYSDNVVNGSQSNNYHRVG